MDKRLRGIADYLLTKGTSADVDPHDIDSTLLPHFYVLDILRGAELRLRVRLAGTAIDKALGRPVKDHCLEEFLHGPRSADVLGTFHACAETHAPIWMRQVVRVKDAPPRFVEGIAVYMPGERIYGGLVVGEFAVESHSRAFESAPLTRNAQPV